METKFFNIDTTIPTFESDGIFIDSKEVTPLQAVLILYNATKDKKQFQEVHIPWELEEFAVFTYEANGFSKDLITVDLELIPTHLEYKDVVLTMFTGGKDSFSSFVKYSHLAEKDVNVFIKGLNPLYPNEYKNALMLADELGISLDIIEVKLPKVVNQPESPVKNALTYVLAIEHLGYIPDYFSFGHTTGYYVDNHNEIVEEDGNKEVYDDLVDTYLETGEFRQIAGVQASLVSGDTLEASYMFDFFFSLAYGDKVDTQGTKDEIEAYRWQESYGLGQKSSSCMSSIAYKKPHKNRLNAKYSIEIQGKNLIAGTVYLKNRAVSIFDFRNLARDVSFEVFDKDDNKLGDYNINDIPLSAIDKKDWFGEYECGVCWKDTERYIVYSNHFGYQYADGFILNAKESIYRFYAKYKDENMNSNDDKYYIQEVLQLRKSEVPKKYLSQKSKMGVPQSVLDKFLK